MRAWALGFGHGGMDTVWTEWTKWTEWTEWTGRLWGIGHGQGARKVKKRLTFGYIVVFRFLNVA
jgi:hypothetical protein